MLWKRRDVFKKSLKLLKERAEYGVQRSQGSVFGMFAKSLHTEGDENYVVKLREFGVKTIEALLKVLHDPDEVAAMMLVVALDAAHKSVMTVS